jgi:NitT/TauT family transport system ATP-binding protein
MKPMRAAAKSFRTGAEPAMALIRARGLSKTYPVAGGGEVTALTNLDFEIFDGEFVSVVGQSGCGKSTLLKLLAGLLPATAGTVELNGGPLCGPSREAAVVFQSPVLLPWRTVLDNVLLPAEILRLDKAKARARATSLIGLVGLSGFEAHYPRELSGGMQQRVALCRALIHNPSVLLMDEPFAALDAMTREELGFELMRIWDADKKTVIFVTHNITEAILLADRVVAMSPRPGRIAKIVDIALPRPRTIDMEFLSAFKSYSEEIRAVIYQSEGSAR